MAGSMRLVIAPDTWELRVYKGRDSAGKVKHRYQRFQGSKRQAERELARLVAEQEAKPSPVVESELRWSSTTTINDAIEAWKNNGWQDLSLTTARRYDGIWNLQIKNGIGRRRILSLTPYEVETYLRSLKESGLSEASVRQVRAVMNRACKLARKWSQGTIPNPVADSELPTWSLDALVPVRPPSIEEVKALQRAASQLDIRICAMLHLIVATGMRRGEACGLQWQDIDFEEQVVSINKSVIVAKATVAVKSPKTLASIRRVAIDSDTTCMLKRLIVIQRELAGTANVSLGNSSFVFSFEPGGENPPYPDSISHGFSRARGIGGLSKDLHLHSLRHFQATAIDSIISEKQKQSRLGWTNPAMARHYTGSVPGEDRRAAEYIGQLLSGSTESKYSAIDKA